MDFQNTSNQFQRVSAYRLRAKNEKEHIVKTSLGHSNTERKISFPIIDDQKQQNSTDVFATYRIRRIKNQ